MITFIPKRPESLTPNFFRSARGDEALDYAFKRYCEIYFERLGTGYYTQWEAQREAEHMGYHAAMTDLLVHCQGVEKGWAKS